MKLDDEKNEKNSQNRGNRFLMPGFLVFREDQKENMKNAEDTDEELHYFMLNT